LKLLNTDELSPLARSEVDWYLLSNNRDLLERLSQGPDQTTLNENHLKQTTAATKLYFDAQDTKRGIVIAKSALRFRNNPESQSPAAAQCFARLWQISFPQPMPELFTSAAKKERTPVALVLAITRSESYFDPLAKSSAGALGLMQLMPETAKLEGLKEGENLLEADVNVQLGARHLTRLLSMFNNETVYVAAAYNAGINAVNRWRNRYTDLPPEAWAELIGYPETATYVRNVVLSEAVYRELVEKHP
jgi:soluble lytic murein transglycosylase-like protein